MDVTYQEISNQPKSWAQTLAVIERVWPALNISFAANTHVLFIGCGTSFYLAQSAARLFQAATGLVSTAIPASEVILTAESTVPKDGHVVAFAISRSGTTSEVLMAVEHLHQHCAHVRTVGVTCHSEQTLAKIAQAVIGLDHASEQSVVMTQSFTNMLLALQWIGAGSGQRTDLLAELQQLPQKLENSIVKFADFGKLIGSNATLSQYIYLGLGAYYGLATEATLKLKEMTQTPCEAYNPLEFRHGPISIVEPGTAVVFLVSKSHASYIGDVVSDVKQVQGFTIALAPSSVADSLGADATLPLDDDLSDWSRTVLYMPALQYLAHQRAVFLGLNPDQPRNLNQVVVLKTASR